MERYRILISSLAEQDLREIVTYISSQLDAPITALKMMELFKNKISSLSNLPERYPLVADERLARMGYRKLVVKKYLVFFSIIKDEKIIHMERILYAKRNWLRFLDD